MNRGELTRAVESVLLGEPTLAQDKYALLKCWELGSAKVYAGFGPSGGGAILVPLAKSVVAAARRTSGLSLSAETSVAFQFDGAPWTQPAVVLECIDPSFRLTFATLCASVIGRLAELTEISWPVLLGAFNEWEQLLRKRRALGREEELGVWGELTILLSGNDLDEMVAAWRSPDGATTDFYLAGVGFDVKATQRPNSAFVSHGQVAAEGGANILIILDAIVDPANGSSVSELVHQVHAKCADPVELEERLLACGLCTADAHRYQRRYACRTRPKLYRAADVPQVRAMDSGVSELRYRVELDPRRAVPNAEVAGILPFLVLPVGAGSDAST